MKSIHIQNFPQEFFTPDEKLVREMDIIREICSAILSIRRRFNLRARLPLSKVTIIGENVLFIESYKKFILEEGNIKKVILDPNLARESKVKLEIIFKKVGEKVGNKMPLILQAIKDNSWKKLSNGSILIADEILSPEDFNLKLIPVFEGENYESIENKFLVVLETSISNELETEGIARDFVRAVQNGRKDIELEVNDKITLFYQGSEPFEIAIITWAKYIKEQCLIESLVKQKDDGSFIKCEVENLDACFKIVKI